jgi:hypothetical protein
VLARLAVFLIVLQISSSDSGSLLEFAQVIDTWLEFPAPDGTLRRASLADTALDRCVEGALQGARLGSEPFHARPGASHLGRGLPGWRR